MHLDSQVLHVLFFSQKTVISRKEKDATRKPPIVATDIAT